MRFSDVTAKNPYYYGVVTSVSPLEAFTNFSGARRVRPQAKSLATDCAVAGSGRGGLGD